MHRNTIGFGDARGRLRAGALVGGRFLIGGQAGSGGMATVFRATDRLTGRDVALKVLRGDDEVLIERFRHEAAMLAELDHPGIVRYVAHDVSGEGARWVAMEWFEGDDLFSLLARRRLSVVESLTIAHRAAQALGFAHARGMVHRDVKPSNILVPPGDVAGAKIIDFGVARLVEDTRRLTETGVIMGTPAYMAPEHIQGLSLRDPRGDVFSLGCVLFECLAGRPVFEGTNVMAVFAKILLQEVPSLRRLRPELPAPLAHLVTRMLAKDAAERPPDGAALAEEIEALHLLGDARAMPARAGTGGHAVTADCLEPTVRSMIAQVPPASPPAHAPGDPGAPPPGEGPRPLCVLWDAGSPYMGSASPPRDPAPGSRDAAPPAGDSASPPRDSAPGSRDSGSLSGDSAPGSRDSAPGSRDSVSGVHDSEPLSRDSASFSRDSAGPSLTLSEHRLVSLVLAGDPDAMRDAYAAPSALAAELQAAVEPHGGSLSALAGGALIVTVWGEGTALDRAESAVRCALAVQARLADQPVCVTTGRGRVLARVVDPDLVEAAVAMLRATRPGAVRLDTGTADMVRLRFQVEQAEGGALLLRGERAADEGAALLLGRRTPCVGRGRELSILEAVLAGCVEESIASPVLITGPAGSGKSRLCRELLGRLREQGRPIEVLVGRGSSVGAGSPFSVLADAIRNAAGIRQGESLPSRREKLAARVGRHLGHDPCARVTTFLGEMVGISFPGDGAARQAAAGNAMLVGDSVRAAWQDWLAAECAAGPVLLVLEDLDRADAATVSLVDATLRNLHDRPLMVLALARPDLYSMYPDFWGEHNIQQLRLAPLARRAAERLVEETLGTAAPPEVAARIIERAEGNPFYLEELIRAVAAGRSDALPDSVLAAVEARLDAAGSQAKRVLRAASIFGDRFSSAGVEALVGGDEPPSEVANQLAMLARRELLTRVGPSGVAGGTDYAFRHALVREAAAAMLTEADRAVGHRLAGAWLEQTGHADAMTVAEHFRLGGAPRRAVGWYRRAAEQALEANDLGAAVLGVARGVECGATGGALGSLRLIEAEALLWRGELGPAEASGAQAISLFPAGSSGWFRAITRVVVAAGKLGGIDRVEGWIRQACAAVPTPAARGAQLDCLCWIATYLTFGGRHTLAGMVLELLERAAGDLRELAPQQIALIEQTRAIRSVTSGDLAAGLDGFRAAIAAFEQVGDQRNAAAVRSNLGFTLGELGDFAGAEEVLRAALAASSRLGLLDSVATARHNLGVVLALRRAAPPAPGVAGDDRLEEARIHEQQAIEMFRRLGDPRMESLSRVYLARIHLLSGDPEAALREARAAAEAVSDTPAPRAAALAVLAQVQLDRGVTHEAYMAAREAYATLEALGSLDDGAALVRLAYAQALSSIGEGPRAQAVLTGARSWLLERAAKIGDPSWRQRFLVEVPDNALTLELAERAGEGAPAPAPSP